MAFQGFARGVRRGFRAAVEYARAALRELVGTGGGGRRAPMLQPARVRSR